MQQVIAARRADPAPSRWSYRYQRLMLTPLFRNVLRVGLPFCLAFAVGSTYLSSADRQERIAQALFELRHEIESRPEFMVQLLAVEGASETLEQDIRQAFPFDFPASSFDIDLPQVRELVLQLPAVADADVRIRRGGTMVVSITERQPAAIWRTRDGLAVMDGEGVVLSGLLSRADRPGLPVLAGKGADKDVPHAMQILTAAGPLGARVQGLVRVGERRWDVVLNRGQRILLPEEGAVRALERVIVLDQSQMVLGRDLSTVDMRLNGRPTVRMNERAADLWRQDRKVMTGTSQQ